MKRSIRVLHVEDDPVDAELVGRSLPKDGEACEIRVVDSRAEFERLLRDWAPDVILSDYNLPAFSGLEALDVVRGGGSDIPFIFVSGTIGEDRAVEVLRRGATDYVLKDRLARLPNAIARSMEGREERRQRIEAERALGDIAETIHEAFWILSPDRRRVLYANPAFEKIWGRPLAEIVGAVPAVLMEAIHPEDRARAEACFSLVGEKDVEGEYRILRPEGAPRWVRFRWYVGHGRGDGSGVERVIGTAEDITEARRLREQFLQSQKMEAVGRLAGGVAHDFNNLLTIIAGYAELALARLPEAEPARDMVREIRDAGERAAHLTRQLLSFSRKDAARPVLLDLGQVVADLDKMLRRLIGDQISLESLPTHSLWAVEADRGQVEQALMNLLVNARDALPPQGGRITIAAENLEVACGRIGPDVVEIPGRYVRVSVTDTGSGMSPEIQARLFEPFFTTKEVGKGTGLGLSTVHSIVRQNGGYIEALSEPGRGSTFRVYLPRASKDPGTERRSPAGAAGPDGLATILLVDDSETLRRLCTEILKSGGFRVQAVENGPAALRILGAESAVDLLLSDLMMPGMTGPELLGKALRARPGLRVLLMSGYADPAMGGPGLEAFPGVAVVQKPFTREGLLEKVREVLRLPPTRNAT